MKIIKNIVRIITILGILIACDIYSIYFKDKPIFVIEKTTDRQNKVYKGIFYDTYYCEEFSSPQIKLKNSKYSCSNSDKENDNKNEVENSKSIASLTLVGDLLFEQPYYNAINNGEDINKYFNRVKKYFTNDDLSIGNMEVVIGNDKLTTSGTGYNFCAPKYIGDLVNTLDFEVLGTANNHSYDRGIDGINSTIDFFKNNTDIVTVGTYKDSSDRNNLRVLDINGIKFGFLAYTYGTNQKPKEENYNLIGYYKNPLTKELTDDYKNIIKREVEELKKISDVTIVIMHWGIEFTYTPNNEQKEMAKYLNELGVDIIMGSHSHNIQPIEIIENEHKTLVFYSLGNFTSHDDDIARTPHGEETFDNAYQVGLLATLNVIKENNEINIDDINTELIINYFDKNMQNFELIPYTSYSEEYEKSHYRYNLGLTKDFINNMYEKVIDDSYKK